MSLGNRKSKDLMQELGDASSPQLVRLVLVLAKLIAEDSSEMVLKKGKGWGEKRLWYTRSGLKMHGGSYSIVFCHL